MLKIKVIKDFRNLKSGDVYEFEKYFPICVVGGNGCGKSSLFQALRGFKNDLNSNSLYADDFKKLSKNIEVEHDYEKMFFYDSVKDDGRDFMVGYDASEYLSSGAFQTKDKSHGESSIIGLNIFLNKIIKEITPNKSLLILDEIDKGFSFSLMTKYDLILYNISIKYEIDIIAITHNPFAMIKTYLIYDFEKRNIELSEKYIKNIGNVEIKFG